MSELHEALAEIRTIRQQVAASTEFRGHGPLSLSGTALCAVSAGLLQARLLPSPAAHPVEYVALWLTTGAVSAALIAGESLRRAERIHSGFANDMLRAAVMQFLPAGLAGVLLPLVLLHGAPVSVWMLPGLWQIVFSLGIFASRRSLPRAMLLAGVWFFATGFECLSLGDTRALSPLAMAVPFGAGMLYVAAVHLVSARRRVSDEG